MPGFNGFDDADFDAYAESKWSSNVYTLERLRVKEKLVALGRLLLPGLGSTDGSPLACEVSAEHPAVWNNRQVKAQHLYFMRSEEARRELQTRVMRGRKMASLLQDPSPFREHLHLCVCVEHDGLTVAAELDRDARVDHENLVRKLENHWERTKVPALIQALPSRFQLQVGSDPAEPAAGADLDPIVEKLASTGAPEGSGGGERVLNIFNRTPRTDETLTSDRVVDAIRADLEALLPIYHFIEWSRANDHVAVAEDIRKEKQKKRKRGLDRNDRVRVVTGVWAGKKGTVQEVDARGTVKVLIGKVTVQLSVEDLVRL